jgi:hypothetical protein
VDKWEGRKTTRQAGQWVCIFTRQAWILLAFGELTSGYPHTWNMSCHYTPRETAPLFDYRTIKAVNIFSKTIAYASSGGR